MKKEISGLISTDTNTVLIDATWLDFWFIKHFDGKRIKVIVEEIE